MTAARHSRAEPNTVLRGDHGFLFFTDHQVVEQLDGAYPLTPDQLERWIACIRQRYEWCMKNNAEMRFFIIPEKHVVYSDYFPQFTISNNRPAMQILASLPEHIGKCVYYPLDDFVRARKNKDVFYRTDTHYTSETGFLTYQILMNSLSNLNLRRVNPEDTKLVHSYRIGDLGMRLEPQEGEDAVHVHHASYHPCQRIYDNELYKRGNCVIFTSPRTDAPKSLIFRDSFFTYIMPHIIPVCSRTVAISSIDMHYDVAEAEKPDIVIFQAIERFLANNAEDGQRIIPNDPIDGFERFSGISAADLANIV
ncbi:hypothetical protein ACGGKE_04950 [Sphingobium naphthae]|uniref:hypothetical protein n=1 Tax=Sphingobium naphthae TaxID=1886786 RepID=UPI0037478C89